MEKTATTRPEGVTRRGVLRTLGMTALALPWLSDEGLRAFDALQQPGAASAPKALCSAAFAALDALVEAIIPADERSPGARKARVADYVDLLLQESDEEGRLPWTTGLDALDVRARQRFGALFHQLPPDALDALMTEISQNEDAPETPLQHLFVLAKQATIDGYYTSKIGVHEELRYKGNTSIRDFVGCAVEDGKNCPYCGQEAALHAE